MRFLTAGDRALLVELDTGGESSAATATTTTGAPGAGCAHPAGEQADPEPATLYRALIRTPPPGTLEFVPAARTILIRFDPARTNPAALADTVHKIAADTPEERDAQQPGPRTDTPGDGVIDIPVRYDGEDLDEVAAQAAMSVADVVARHSGTLYTVAFCGFAPGFGYLTGLDPALHLPRRAVPRTRVPAGSVAIADRYTAVYPHPSPGGWLLLGRTETRVWDPARQPPALLPPGTRVRFIPQRPQHQHHDHPAQPDHRTEHRTGKSA